MLTPKELTNFRVIAQNKKHEFWQRDSLAIELYTPDVAYQKLEYIHLNPMGEKWDLVADPCDYVYSSAAFYERGDTRFEFLKHISEELWGFSLFLFREDTNQGGGRPPSTNGNTC